MLSMMVPRGKITLMRILTVVGLCALFGMNVFAQNGTITGTIADPAGVGRPRRAG